MGEGWLLTAEMLELIHSGTPNIVCTQPFGCLPNHIVGKGMIRKLKDDYPFSNIVAIDYDPGATKINQENRIKLMLANARGLAKQEAERREVPHPASAGRGPRFFICAGELNSPGIKVLPPAKRLYAPPGAGGSSTR